MWGLGAMPQQAKSAKPIQVCLACQFVLEIEYGVNKSSCYEGVAGQCN